jgi:RNA polymerase sigma factor (sigma-70 family)
MEAFCNGDQEAFAQLFERYAQGIQRLIVRLTGDSALATDLTQITFLSVIRGRTRFAAGTKFQSWLYTIAMNALRDHKRRSVREVVREPQAFSEVPDEQMFGDTLLARRLLEALASLPAEQREAVCLHQIEGFAFAEIAEMLGEKETTVKVRAHRGYERLRTLLHDIGVSQ